ncbi:hypothetical protein SBA3_3340001 [Candidatus Sulfopaludibacter sp. SbA3]|nr:hypothetical protein SBA3_3340001 [Candidatus Sulfopaludibacter sp. SbA3]
MVDAYSVKRSQISGGPSWLDSERFDIVAKVPEGATKEQVKVMLQNLLAERFKLTLHRETKEQPMYALVVGSKGPKLKDSTVTDTPRASDSQPREGGRGEAGAQAAPPPPLRPGLRGMKIGPYGCPEIPPMAAGRAGNFMMMTPNGECMISRGETMRPPGNRPDRLEGQVRLEAALRPIQHAGRTGRPEGRSGPSAGGRRPSQPHPLRRGPSAQHF